MILTLSPDLNYPNNKLGEFYTILPEDLFFQGNKYQVALTEFQYQVNYIVNLGSFSLEIPSYVSTENNCQLKTDLHLLPTILKQFKTDQIDFENQALEFFIQDSEYLNKKLNEIVSNFEKKFYSYFSLFQTCTADENKLDFINVKTNFSFFYE